MIFESALLCPSPDRFINLTAPEPPGLGRLSPGRTAAERGATFPSLRRWTILNLGMPFSTKCNVRINLRAMVRSISHDYAWDVTWITERQESYLALPYGKTPKAKDESWAGCSTVPDV